METEEKIGLEFNNGDYIALKDAAKLWGFKDVESAIRFGMAVLIKSGDSKEIQVQDASGEKISIKPAISLIKSSEPDDHKKDA